jgi:hypothetical protein
LPILNASRIFSPLSSITCKVLHLLLRFLIHFELILIQGDRHGSSFSFLQADNQDFCWETCCYFDGFTLTHYLFVFSYSLQYYFSVLCACYFNDNVPWGGSISVKSAWRSGGFL